MPAPISPSLTTRAERDGDEYVINGQKIFTSLASDADYFWLAARTDPDAPKHGGISMFMVDMKTPGIRIEPMDLLSAHDINTTFFDDVRVPAAQSRGRREQGLEADHGQLNHERVTLCSSGMMEGAFDGVLRWARETKRTDGTRVIDQEWVQMNLARVWAGIEFLRLANWKVAWDATQGGLDGPGRFRNEGVRNRVLPGGDPADDGGHRAARLPGARVEGGRAAGAARELLPHAS